MRSFTVGFRVRFVLSLEPWSLAAFLVSLAPQKLLRAHVFVSPRLLLEAQKLAAARRQEDLLVLRAQTKGRSFFDL